MADVQQRLAHIPQTLHPYDEWRRTKQAIREASKTTLHAALRCRCSPRPYASTTTASTLLTTPNSTPIAAGIVREAATASLDLLDPRQPRPDKQQQEGRRQAHERWRELWVPLGKRIALSAIATTAPPGASSDDESTTHDSDSEVTLGAQDDPSTDNDYEVADDELHMSTIATTTHPSPPVPDRGHKTFARWATLSINHDAPVILLRHIEATRAAPHASGAATPRDANNAATCSFATLARCPDDASHRRRHPSGGVTSTAKSR